MEPHSHYELGMILAFAALLLQFPAIPQSLSWSAVPDRPAAYDAAVPKAAQTAADLSTSTPLLDAAPAPMAALSAPADANANFRGLLSENLLVESKLPIRNSRLAAITVIPEGDLRERSEKLVRREWLALSLVQHGAATFDAWSTRQAISSGRAQELNPVLRPFAGNPSLYAAIQVGPVLFDYFGKRMMTSQHGWVRHVWWIPQALSTAVSIGSGVHNLNLR